MSIIKFHRKIRKSGRSAVIALPTDLMTSLGWEIGEAVVITATIEKAILIERSSQDPD